MGRWSPAIGRRLFAIVQQDFFQTDLSRGTVITLFLYENVNVKLRPLLLAAKSWMCLRSGRVFPGVKLKAEWDRFRNGCISESGQGGVEGPAVADGYQVTGQGTYYQSLGANSLPPGAPSNSVTTSTTTLTTSTVTNTSSDRGSGCVAAAAGLTCSLDYVGPENVGHVIVWGVVGQAGAQTLSVHVRHFLQDERATPAPAAPPTVS